ncbi:MerR family transcriptional regulator [Rhodocytophaga rosea]|uniref:MerR family transcriptional regulator n=1 Tax=Rhodocytophaga rosea TaxID=2704465 RepID=A0A6C0GHU4_9BACT|nr:MerR family transcriptional regulator [Rhodocytophaga rosea]QHT67465.1 MerR family transcriptional regulator [Rhodocytophaga rosea]
MSVYSIKDLEHLSGIKAHTLRIWEQRYSIITPKRTDTNIRLYDDIDLKLVLNISLLKDHGFKISEIARMSADDITQEVMTITEKKLNYPDQIQALTISMIDLDEDRFEKIMATNILQQGFEQTMIKIIYPFLTKIGVLWQTGAIGPSQEHFISNLIRQKLIVAIDGQLPSRKVVPKKFMLYLPDGELHELSLLFANYILRARQHKVVYLGQSLPFHDLCAAFQVHKPEYLLSIITSMPSQHEVQPYVDKLAAKFPGTQILLSGFQVVSQDISAPENITIVRNIQELIDFAEEEVTVVES